MCGKLPQGLLFLENRHFGNFRTSPFSKSVYFLILNTFSKNGSPGQTTMLIRRAAKFCVEPWSPFSYISHHDPKTLGKRLIIISWPECRPEFPNDDDVGGGGFPRTLSIWSDAGSITHRDQISRAGNPSLRCRIVILVRECQPFLNWEKPGSLKVWCVLVRE